MHVLPLFKNNGRAGFPRDISSEETIALERYKSISLFFLIFTSNKLRAHRK
jgi:hypothetical protein